MKVGVTLPQFCNEAGPAIAAAERAEHLGLDGAFCFDHLWPLGQPGRPALSQAPLLGALAASTTTIGLGSLVTRIGLLPDEVLLSMFASLAAISRDRFIAGIGTGDRLSRAENLAFGVPFDPAAERRARVRAVAEAAEGRGIPVWIGGSSDQAIDLARAIGAPVNLWEVPVSRGADVAAKGVEVTWGGPLGVTAEEVGARLSELAGAGATWGVCAWPDSLDVVADAANTVRSSS